MKLLKIKCTLFMSTTKSGHRAGHIILPVGDIHAAFSGKTSTLTCYKINHRSVYLQAGMFYLPYYLWSHLEGGMIESFGKDAKSAVILKDDDKYRD